MRRKVFFEATRRMRMSASLALLVGTGMMVVVAIGVPCPAAGQNAGVGTSIYRGDTPQVSGITLTSWGSGTVESDTKLVFSGSQSLKITTQGLYQGARIALGTPTDLGPYLSNQYADLQFVIRTPGSGRGQGGFAGFRGGFPGGFSGGPGGFPGGPGGFPGGPGGFPGGQGGRGPFGQGGQPGQQQQQQLENLRVLLITSGDKALEMRLPLVYARNENQWQVVSIPIKAISGLSTDDAKIKEVRIFGDAQATFWLGQIRVAVDATPIVVQPVVEKVVPRNVIDRYIGTATGGYTALKYTWDFDASDGIQDEGEGRVVTHAYYKSGDYVATLTVSDLYGIKPAAKTTFKVHITR